MKRSLLSGDVPAADGKRLKLRDEEEDEERPGASKSPDAGSFGNLDENMLFEVLRHVDARTLATAACVSRGWRRTAHDEALWEVICTRRWANIGCGSQRLRRVVLALGGFRRLHALCVWPLLKSPAPSSARPSPSPPPLISPRKTPTHWGKDEVHLSLSLLSIRYYEKMNYNSRSRSN
ncbi:F-box protein GID2-like [Malania oleifera]|uniref:F-box protein GID2-like n=1 Tax=Malania oleifera TaxID=397392 RepID=UPI0025AE7D3F|nr:F-box protein GID2-like [Malania oleifera]